MSSSPQRRLHLNAFLMAIGHHEAAWRLPESDPNANLDIKHYISLAQTAERGKFDSVFLADSPVLFSNPERRPSGKLEPTIILTAISAATEKIGLIATASTSYNEPYNLARRFASLDFVSGGRAGWNIVTTAGADAAQNFGLDDTPAHRSRYERAAEFVEVSTKLWDSWEDDAIVADKEVAIHADSAKVHVIEHEAGSSRCGDHSTCRGRRRDTRCSCRRGRPRTERISPPGIRRPSSPPSPPWTRGRRSTRTSRTVSRKWAGTRRRC